MYVARSSIVMMTVGLAVVGGLSACGRIDQSEKPSGERPPTTLQLSAAITDRGVNLSPAQVGGGPLRIVISNQSQRSVRPSFAGGGGGTARRTRTAIAPGGVAAITADVRKGTWKLRSGDRRIPAASLAVGPRRDSADGELLLP